jgi:hypothetical protein
MTVTTMRMSARRSIGLTRPASPPGAAISAADRAREDADHPQEGEDDREGEQPLDRESEAEEEKRQNRE